MRKRRGGGPFSSRLPIRILKAAASAHNFALSASCKLGRSISSDAENEVKVIDAFLFERETTENVINTGLSASCSKANYGMSECRSGMSGRAQQADKSHWGFKDNSCLLPPPPSLQLPRTDPLWVIKSWEDSEAQTNNWIRSRMVCRQIGQVLSAALQSMQEAWPHWKTSLMWLSMQMGQVIRSSICR